MGIYKNENGKAVKYSGSIGKIDDTLSSTSENPVQNKVITEEINTLKKSVSDGKTAVANAITAKGVETAADATFATMANNIANISSSGGGISLNLFTQLNEPDIKEGIWINTDNNYEKIVSDESIVCSDGTLVTNISSTPFTKLYAYAFERNNLLYVISRLVMYVFDGTAWTNLGSLPSATGYVINTLVKYNNEPHIVKYIGRSTYLYTKWDGTSWIEVSNGNLPYTTDSGAGCVVYNGKIYNTYCSKYGNDGPNTYGICTWDGTAFTILSSTFNMSHRGYIKSVVYNGYIYIFARDYDSRYIYHYLFDGSSISNLGYIGNGLHGLDDFDVVVYDNKIHLFSGSYHYEYDGISWTQTDNLPYVWGGGDSVEVKDQLHLIFDVSVNSTGTHAKFTAMNKAYDPHTVIIKRGDNPSGIYMTSFVNLSDIISGKNRFAIGFDDVYYFNETDLDRNAKIYYGDGTQWVNFKN